MSIPIIRILKEESIRTIYNNIKFYIYKKLLSQPLYKILLSAGYIDDSTYVLYGITNPGINIETIVFNDLIEHDIHLAKKNILILIFYNIDKSKSIYYEQNNLRDKITLYKCNFNFNFLKNLTYNIKQSLINRHTIAKYKSTDTITTFSNFKLISYKNLNQITKSYCDKYHIEYIENIELSSDIDFIKKIKSPNKQQFIIVLYQNELISFDTLDYIRNVIEKKTSKHLVISNFKFTDINNNIIPRFHSHSCYCNNLISENSFVVKQDILEKLFAANYHKFIYNLQVYSQNKYDQIYFCPAIFTTTNKRKPRIENVLKTIPKKSKTSQQVSIIIPFKDKIELLAKCLSSIKKNTFYNNYEIVLVNNNSQQIQTYEYLNNLNDINITVLNYTDKFNYSQINNFAVTKTTGSYFLFLNNDTEIITINWITKMMEYATLDEVGAVGPLLLFENQSIQQQGVYLSYRDLSAEYPIVDHISKNLSENESVDYDIIEPKAITGACLLTSKSDFNKYGPFDSINFPINFNDIDYCLKVRQDNKKILVLNDVRVIHKESATRNIKESAHKEFKYFHSKWKQEFDDLEIKYI